MTGSIERITGSFALLTGSFEPVTPLNAAQSGSPERPPRMGIVSLVVLPVVIFARYWKHLAGAWRGVYVASRA